MLGPCFVVQHFVVFLVLQSSHSGREYFCGILNVMFLLLFIASGLWCVNVAYSLIIYWFTDMIEDCYKVFISK